MKYLYLLGAVVLSVLTANSVYAQMPPSSEITEMTQHATHNSAMLRLFTMAITTCTDEVTARTFTHWDVCFKITKDFDAAMSGVTTNNLEGIKSLTPFASLLSP